MDAEAAPYSSRITKNYLDFLRKYHPECDLDRLLERAGISRYEVEDPAHWLTQTQINRFHDALTLQLQDPDLPRKVGRFLASAEGLGSVKKYALGFVNPMGAYKLSGRMAAMFSRAQTITSRPIGSDGIEIIAAPKAGIQERPFQCENRLGTFQALAELFTSKPAAVDHPECVHRGDAHCRYLIRWGRSPALVWKRVRNYLALAGIPAVPLLYVLAPPMSWPIIGLTALAGLLSLSLHAEALEKKDLRRALVTEGETAETHLDEVNRRYNTSLLIQKIGQAAASLMDPDDLCHQIMAAMKVHLWFDRGMIMLATSDRRRLAVVAGFGYQEDQERLLQEAIFHLDRPGSRGVFVRTFHEQKASLVNDIAEIEADLSEKSRMIAHQIGTRSLICVPIIYEKASLGILAVDNYQSGHPLTQSDVNLLTGVASQAAASIVSAESYKKLVDSELRFRGAFDYAAIGRVIGDTTGRFQRVNRSMCDITGYESHEFRGLSWSDITPPDDRDRVAHSIRELLDGLTPSRRLEMKVLHKSGHTVWVRINLVVIRDASGRPLYLSGDVEDISQRKRFESALEESEGKHRAILETIEEGYFEVDLEGGFKFFNDALCRISGFAREELTGRSFRDYTSPETAERMYNLFNQVYRSGKSLDLTDYEIARSDGTISYLEISASLMRNPEGKPTGFRGIVRDVTDRKAAEEEKRQLEAQIQHSQKMEAVGTLAGGIAHDFNNLLMGIQGNVSLMMMDIDARHPHYEGMDNIRNYVERCARLTRQLLGFARGGKYEVSMTHLNDLVSRSTEMFGRTRKEISVSTHYQDDLWPVEADPGQIEQVLLNLFVNAWQAMPNGGSLCVETRNVTLDRKFVRPHDVKPGPYIRISVTDTGIGMNVETRRRIFEPFFTTKERGEGTGLGLASAYGIVKNHGGVIDVDSQVGVGTTFHLYLPARKEATVDEPVDTGEVLQKGAGTILFIDDEDMILQVGAQMLVVLGYTVLTSASGSDGVALFKERREAIDLVILDMIMPEQGGLETFNALRQIDPDVKVLLASGYSAEGQAVEIMKQGCNGFIQKPFNLNALSRKITRILSGLES